MRWHSLIAVSLAVLALEACSSKKVIQTQTGTTTIETNALHNTVKVTSKQGTAVIGKGAVDPSALGLPFYPGAISSQTGGMAATTQEGSSHVVSLTTKDPFDQVYQWYKGHMPAGSEQLHMEAASGSIATFLIGKQGDRDQRSVQIQASQNTTTILLSHITKNG